MNTCLFVSDLHGKVSRYEALFKLIRKEKPDFVFMGGDLLPRYHKYGNDRAYTTSNFIEDFLFRKFSHLKDIMECAYPDVYLIPGNDDIKIHFETIAEGDKAGLWQNLHNRCMVIGKYRLYGYACVPPTPFRIKDWERYDISVEPVPGSIAPSEGVYSVKPEHDSEHDTIEKDIQKLVNKDDLEFGIFLFHSPPYNSVLDQAALASGEVLAVGSKAIRKFIEEKQPYITMHGHIHESASITGEWKLTTGRTCSFSAAHAGPELAVVNFELNDPHGATRRLIKT